MDDKFEIWNSGRAGEKPWNKPQIKTKQDKLVATQTKPGTRGFALTIQPQRFFISSMFM